MAELIGREHQDRQNGSLTSRAKAYVSTEARHLMEERRVNERMAERVDRYGRTVGIVRERIPESDSRSGRFLEELSRSLDRIGDCLRTGDYRGARHEARNLADEHPELFVGIAFGAGAFLGRVLREMIVENKEAHGELDTRSEPSPTAGVGPGGPQGV